MKLTEWDLAHQVLEFRQRDGSLSKVEPFVLHERPDEPNMGTMTLNLPRFTDEKKEKVVVEPREIEVDTSEHGCHTFVLRGEDGFEDRSFLVLCDGTIISAQG